VPSLRCGEVYDQALTTYLTAVRHALLTEYSEIFVVTAVICVAGAALSLLLGSRRTGSREGCARR